MGEDSASSNARHCPACGRASGQSRGQKNDFQLLACRSCDTLYTAHLPKTNQSQDYYDSYYTSENLTVSAFIDKHLDGIVATFEPYRKNNRLLDVGCGAGTFLEASARAGWDAFGVEVSRTAAEHVRGRGFEVFCGELEKAGYPDEHFDVLILSEVLEHVPDPRALLEASARVLRSGGLLWATTPHGRGISARLLGLGWSTVCPPEHLQLFSVSSIMDLLTSGGFRQIELATHGTNPYEIVHELSRRANKVVRPERAAGVVNFNRVESSYELNESLSGNKPGRLIKTIVNGLLNAGRIGDSIKIRAEKRDR